MCDSASVNVQRVSYMRYQLSENGLVHYVDIWRMRHSYAMRNGIEGNVYKLWLRPNATGVETYDEAYAGFYVDDVHFRRFLMVKDDLFVSFDGIMK